MAGIDEQIDDENSESFENETYESKFLTRNGWEGGVECGRVTQTGGQVGAPVDERWAEAQAGGRAGGWTSRQMGGEMTKICQKRKL